MDTPASAKEMQVELRHQGRPLVLSSRAPQCPNCPEKDSHSTTNPLLLCSLPSAPALDTQTVPKSLLTSLSLPDAALILGMDVLRFEHSFPPKLSQDEFQSSRLMALRQ
jgi:hypothetical protein